MFYTIYQITNTLNGKIYIGKHQTRDLNDGYMGSGKHLKQSIAKYGIENFKKEILFRFDNEAEMNSKEVELVTEEFCKRDDTYNICQGGKGGFNYLNWSGKSNIGWKTNGKDNAVKGGLSFANRLANDEEFKEEFLSKRQNFVYSKAFAGKSHSDETKKKIGEINSVLQSGNSNSQFGTIWITNEVENRKIKKNDPIPDGWRLGRKMKFNAEVAQR